MNHPSNGLPDWAQGIALPASGFLWICTEHFSMGFEQEELEAHHHLTIHEESWIEEESSLLCDDLIHVLGHGDDCDNHDWAGIDSLIESAKINPAFSNLPDDFWNVNGPHGKQSCGMVRRIIDSLLVPTCNSHVIHVPSAMHAMQHRTEEVARMMERHNLLPIVAANEVLIGRHSLTWVGEQLADEFSDWLLGQ